MPNIPQVRALSGDPIGAAFDEEDGTVDITFVLESGDHLHILLNRVGLESLSRHIEHVSEQMRAQTARSKGK